jgi:two-component system chemotaxis response regulator CheY
LARARLFSLKAGTEMRAIIDADRPALSHLTTADSPAKGRDPVWLCERLSIIQRQAKRARARAVYRSAQDALGLIQRCNAHMPIDWKRVDGRLFVLNKLLGQYETGLNEIAPVALNDTDVQTETAETEPGPAFDPVQAIARETLTALLPHASDDERDALSRLMDIDTRVAQSIEEDISEPEPVSVAEPAKADRIEWIMPDLVQSLLALGREYGKIVSVSHSLDDVLIKADQTDTVIQRLHDRLGDLITGSLPLQGVGRIDLAESEDGLYITGSGFEAFNIALPERIETSLETLADTIEAGSADISPVPTEPLALTSPPMITDDTEAELRKQLAALMDGGIGRGDPKSCGQDALDQCAGLRPDVVMLDWKLPDMSGQAFMDSLRKHMDKNELEMPTILFCTAERSVEQIVSALKAGADEYIMKPFDSDIIGSKFALAGLLNGSGIGEEAACAAP